MKALTLTQPWATLVAIGAKHVETRSWRCSYRGPLAIHAAKGFPKDARGTCLLQPFTRILTAAGFDTIDQLPRGQIIAVARLTACRPTSEASLLVGELEHEFGDYGPDRWGWFLEEVRKLETPMPAIGALGLWTVPRELRDRIGGWSL